ncbi:hypothetical protein N9Y81_01280 [Akkermansiaceae bacterium]|nr:hypothetical protein [Akkermansiaceae bacterium]
MAIQEFGQSLLSDIRERNERERRRARKQEEKDLLLGIGMKVADSALTSYANRKTNKFLQSETFLANNLQYKTQLKKANKDITDYQGFQENPNYFINEYVQLHKPAWDAYANANSSVTDLSKQLQEAAQKHSEERLAELNEDRIKAARSLAASSGGSETAYRDAVIASRPQGGIKGAVMSFGNFITGGTAHDAALMTNLHGKSETYKSLYKQNPTLALSTVKMQEQLAKNGVTFSEAPITYGERFTRKDTAIFGGTKDTTAYELLQNGKVWGYQNSNGERISLKVEAQTLREQYASREVPTVDEAKMVQQQFSAVIPDRQAEILQDIAVSNYGTTAEDKAQADAGLRDMYGNLRINSVLLQQQIGMTENESMVVAAEIEILRQQVRRGGQKSFDFDDPANQVIGFETETNANSVSPLLTMAAVDSLQQRNVLGRNTAAYEKLRREAEAAFSDENNPFVGEFIKTFGELDYGTQSDMVTWMKQYPTFTARREDGTSVISELINDYPHLNPPDLVQMPVNPYTGRRYNDR